MSYKKISVALLTIIFIVASSLSSFNFAVSSTNSNVQAGTHYIKNLENDLYMSDLDYYSVTMSSYGANTQQRWEIVPVSNGYYAIKNTYTGRYLTSPTDTLEGSLVYQETVLNSSYANKHLWIIVPAYNEGSDLILKCSDYLGFYGYDLVQGYYTQYDYLDEWCLEEFQSINLIGIASDGDHSTALFNANNFFMSSGANSNYYTPTSINFLDLRRSYLTTSDVVIICSLGGYDSIGTYMYLDAAQTIWFHTGDIYNYNGNNGINMSDCEVAIFAGCYTANHSTRSLPQAATDAGADIGIGFTKAIGSSETNTWVEKYAYWYSIGTDADESAYSASIYAGSTPTLNSVVVKYKD